MTDVADDAQKFETFRRDIAVRAARAGAHQLATPSDFGLCSGCADPIDAERRKAVPGATRCLTCQEARDRFLRLHPGDL